MYLPVLVVLGWWLGRESGLKAEGIKAEIGAEKI
jgi:hypothetical protein